ncbi:MAG: TatD family deoxyribonuclease [Ruminococcaceae bacterium]|nr:TatD family deoxyribonuclease [Oscillospiraceae bacterium]
MIIDSHAHYALKQFNGVFPYLYDDGEKWAVGEADRNTLFAEMQKRGVVGAIEPSIELSKIEKQLELVSARPSQMWAAVGVHPTRCVKYGFEERTKLKDLAERGGAVAIGETGLDHHYPPDQCDREAQKRWFVYQIELADSLGLPLVLHVRDADGEALEILYRYKDKLHGGVAHCFKGDHAMAERYIELGYAVGIGGKLFSKDEDGEALCDTVKNAPLSSILVETDAPLVAPDVSDVFGDEKQKFRNTSLILPAVIRKIAELRGEPRDKTEETIYQNTLRVFGLKL